MQYHSVLGHDFACSCSSSYVYRCYAMSRHGADRNFYTYLVVNESVSPSWLSWHHPKQPMNSYISGISSAKLAITVIKYTHIETRSISLDLCEETPLVTDGSRHKGPVMYCVDVFLLLALTSCWIINGTASHFSAIRHMSRLSNEW